jgi:hypothetical protein
MFALRQIYPIRWNISIIYAFESYINIGLQKCGATNDVEYVRLIKICLTNLLQHVRIDF